MADDLTVRTDHPPGPRLIRAASEAAGVDEALIEKLVQATGPKEGGPGWTYSDIRMRLYPAALAQVFPDSALTFDQLLSEAVRLRPSPAMIDA